MRLELDLQIAAEGKAIPAQSDFELWVKAALATSTMEQAELTIRVVAPEESQSLNFDYRQKDKPTNVLSFPYEPFEPIANEAMSTALELPLLGDLVICAEIVEAEAQQQNKPIQHHWAHLVIHGVLHLIGYDHITDTEAEEMENLERAILAGLGIQDPYLEQTN